MSRVQAAFAVVVVAFLVAAVSAGYDQWPPSPPSFFYDGNAASASSMAMNMAVSLLQTYNGPTGGPVVLRAAAIALMESCFKEGVRSVAACSAPGTLDGKGDGFVRLTSASLTAKGNAILQAPVNTTVPLDPAVDIEGAYVNVLNQVAALSNITIIYEAPWLPLPIRLTEDRIAQFNYIFDVLKYDIMLVSTVMSFERTPYTRFSVPIQPWGSIVLVPQPPVDEPSLTNRLFTWVTPFTGSVWVVLTGASVLIGMFMSLFEIGRGTEDYNHIDSDSAFATKLMQYGEGIYRSFAHLTSSGGFGPMTLAGRVLYVTYAFTVWLILSCYIANLATLLVTNPSPYQPINSIDDLSNGLYLTCVLDRPVFQRTLNQSYPGVRTKVLAGSTGNIAVQALSDPASPCAAVVAPNVYLQYALGPVMDPQGALCGLDFTGNLLDFGYFAIPYSRRVPPAIVEAINVLILYILDSGAYTQTSLTYDFPVQRPLCAQIEAERAAAAAATAKEPPPLGLTDLAGIFLVLLVGLTLAMVVHCFSGKREAKRGGGGAGAGKGGDAKAIPETFIGDGSPNENVERIVAQTVEAIRAEMVATLGKITREQLGQQRGGPGQPMRSTTLQPEDSEPAALDGVRSMPAPLRQGSLARRPPPASGYGGYERTQSALGARANGGGEPAGKHPMRSESEGHISNGAGNGHQQQQFNIFGLGIPGLGSPPANGNSDGSRRPGAAAARAGGPGGGGNSG